MRSVNRDLRINDPFVLTCIMQVMTVYVFACIMQVLFGGFMTQSDKSRRSLCPVTFSLNLFGDKWSLLIIRDLVFKGSKTYSEFLESGEGISTNILADRLKKLETSGIIQKSGDQDNKRKYIYGLTDKGLALTPILIEMIRWGGKYDPDTAVHEELLQQIDKDSKEVVEALKKNYLKNST